MAKRKPKASVTLNPFGIEPLFEKGKTPKDPVKRRIEYGNSSSWYNYETSSKDHASYVIDYAKNQLKYSAADIKSLKSLRDWEISSRIGIPCRMFTRGWEFNAEEKTAVAESMAEKLAIANTAAKAEVTDEPVVRAIPPAKRAEMKVAATIAYDFDVLIDQFIQGNYKSTMNAFNSAKSYSLNAQHVNLFKKIVETEFDSIDAAMSKKCEQAVEAYSHVKRADLKKMHATLTNILQDLEQLKLTKKVVSKSKKPQSADKQIRKLKYKTEDTVYKVGSINPAMIPGKTMLMTFNTKTRFLTMYKTDSVEGLSVKGTSIKGFNPALSKTTRLRKPNDVLPSLLKAKLKKVEDVWSNVTTKITTPNGRCNGDVVLLRAL